MNILVLEDDPELLTTLAEGLVLSFPTFRIETVESAEDAGRLIDEGYEPQLIISDIRLPGKDGIEFLAEIQDRFDTVQFILMSGFEPPAAVMDRVDPARLLHFLPKPFELAELFAKVQDAYMREESSGSHKRIGFIDILQVLSMARRTSMVSVRFPEDKAETGRIYVVDGQIHHAECDSVEDGKGSEGEVAFLALCRCPDADFRVKAGAPPPRRTINVSFDLLLLDAISEA